MIFDKRKISRTAIAALLSIVFLISALSGCSGKDGKVKLDPKNPVTITVWHYYNGSILNAFDAMVLEFNETVGMDKGIIVEGYGLGNITELEKAVVASANKEVGSMDIPNVFASYADTAYEAEKMGILANLDDYFSKEEQQEYFESYIEEGKIGLNGELRIFPVAKSTEIMMLNDTDWQPFAQAYNLAYGDLSTIEGLARVSELYYEWTDSQTPDVPNDGKAFYGRDSMANMFIISSMEFGEEIFQVEGGRGNLNISEEAMRKIWDYYYVPYISGCFTAYGRYRSDDAKVGDLLAYVGSTSSAAYFPNEVTVGDETYPVDVKVLPVPHFENAQKVMVQQGAGMVVTKGTPESEFASVEFLKWFTDVENNTVFSAMSGYMPVKKQASDYDAILASLQASGQSISAVTDETLRTALDEMKGSRLYTNKAFGGGAAARAVLENHLQDKAVSDREAVINLIGGGASREDAVSQYSADEEFYEWLRDMTLKLQEVIE